MPLIWILLLSTEVTGSLLCVIFAHAHNANLLLPLCPRFQEEANKPPAGGICAQKVNYHIAIVRFPTHSEIIIANSRY